MFYQTIWALLRNIELICFFIWYLEITFGQRNRILLENNGNCTVRTARGFRLNTLQSDLLTVGPCHIVNWVFTQYFQNLHVESNPRLAAYSFKVFKIHPKFNTRFRVENVNLLILDVSNDFVIVVNTIFTESPQW